jgi:hypothetical protein
MQKAASLLIELGVLTRTEFNLMKSENRRPENIPAYPERFYKEYPGWKLFVGQGYTEEDAITYEKLKKLNTMKNITSVAAYKVAIKSGILLVNSPTNPPAYFKSEWDGWDNFLAYKQRFVSFEEARSFARRLGLKSSYEWRQYCREGGKPSYIPVLPDRDYPEFVSWSDFLSGDDSNPIC